MKITVLMENTTKAPSLCCEHGLSLYIETGRHRILFDSGQSGAIIENAAELGVDLSNVDIAVLSHGHYDHAGGLLRFLQRNGSAKVYMNQNAFGGYFNRKDRYIGVDEGLKDSSQIIYTGDEYEIDDNLSLSTCNSRECRVPIDSAGLTMEMDGQRRPDTFRHEQYLLIKEDGRDYLISGCSHKGILNIENWFQPDYLIGGFHFMHIEMDDAGKERLQKAAEELLSYKTDYYTGHCTGLEQYEYMKSLMGDRLSYISTGTVLSF
ncbi:MAG: MBL fold metallo-hydrolase [Lachnospiraceae bacterium]|nr:MBL fold metallo-hydrolase [Lachnospiraceae bacterium]